MKLLKLLGKLLAYGVLALLIIFSALLVIFMGASLMLPLWYYLVAGGILILILVRRKKPGIFWKTSLCILLLFVCYYFTFEFIPFGTISSEQTVNDIPFKEIAGTYYHGDGKGMNCSLELTPDGRFFFKWTGCLGVYGRNKGGVEIVNQTITLHPKKPNHANAFGGTPTVFVPVRWDERIYLIPQDQIIKFCSEVNLGLEPRNRPHGQFYLRRQDWTKASSGSPAVGQQWKDYLLVRPVRGKIVRLINNQTGIINLGRENGLREGMILTAQGGEKYIFSEVKVVSVAEAESTVECQWQDSSLHEKQDVTSKFHDEPESTEKEKQ
jgi:hypothetical protein